MKFLVSFFTVLGLMACTTIDETARPVKMVEEAKPLLPSPSRIEVEDAYKAEKYNWITERFRNPKGGLNYTDVFPDYWTWQYVGYAYLQTKDYPRATLSFRQVIAIKPKFSPAIYNLACVASLSKNSEKALEILQLLATRVRPHKSLRVKYRQMVLTDSDLSVVREHPRFNTTLALFD